MVIPIPLKFMEKKIQILICTKKDQRKCMLFIVDKKEFQMMMKYGKFLMA